MSYVDREIFIADEPANISLRDRAQAIAPILGKSSLKRRIFRAESYGKAVDELVDLPKWRRIRKQLSEYTERNGGFFFVQIGANDGIQNDPIRKHVRKDGWKGLLVEPVPHVFSQLVRNYRSYSGLQFANVAVSDKSGTAPMLTAVELPGTAKNPMNQISSFRRDVIEKHSWMVGDVEQAVVATEVDTLTLHDLFDRHGILKYDGLFVDTEGHDKVVLDQVDLVESAPPFILYEHAHLTKVEQADINDRLTGHGYDVTRLRLDTFAAILPPSAK